MAKRSILNILQFNDKDVFLKLEKNNIKKGREYNQLLLGHEFSQRLSKDLLNWLQTIPNFKKAKPVALGSWARNEISPFSDVDLLLLGNDRDSKVFVSKLQESGAPFRCRIAKDKQDWTVGVEEVDVLALLQARALICELEPGLAEQKEKILGNRSKKRSILKFLMDERKKRNERYDSITNYLEPNLKYQLGGIRDLNQALALLELYSEKFKNQEELLHQFKKYNSLFLAIRNAIHLMGYNDILLGQIQPEVSALFGFGKRIDFMKLLQETQEFVAFNCNWVFEYSYLSDIKREKIQSKNRVKSLREASSLLLRDSHIISQKSVRDFLSSKNYKSRSSSVVDKLKLLYRALKKDIDVDKVMAFFKSRLIYEFLPELKPLSGLVQLDQYHQYTADAHILKCLLNVLELRKNTKSRFASVFKSFSKADWIQLYLLCLFHDIGKGRDLDHSAEGERISRLRLKQMDVPGKRREDICWLVRNHLLLSKAAFRRNVNSASMLKELKSNGLNSKRLDLLFVFTYIDIISTNPSAWSQWKEDLLFELYDNLRSDSVNHKMKLLEAININQEVAEEVFEKFSDFFIQECIESHLVVDVRLFLESKIKKECQVFAARKKKCFWVRFYRKFDEVGILSEFVRKIYSTGASIRHAEIMSISDFGVYDWFYIKVNKDLNTLRKILKLPCNNISYEPVVFEKVKVVSKDPKEWVISFKTKDQKAILLNAAELLLSEDLSINWARIHTWGQQVDDLFGVEVLNEMDQNKIKSLETD